MERDSLETIEDEEDEEDEDEKLIEEVKLGNFQKGNLQKKSSQ